MRAATLLVALAVASATAGLALAAQPRWRVADAHRALRIGLSLRDVGSPWREAGARRSPFGIDLGAVLSSSLTAGCAGPVPPTKAATDLEVTGGSESTFANTTGTIFSLTMLFKTPTLAHMQMPVTGTAAPLARCLTSELERGLAGHARVTVLGVERRSLDTGSPESYAYRVAARLKFASLSERFYLDVVTQRDGRGIVETAYSAIAAPPTGPLEGRLARISARRLARYAA